MDTAGSLEAHQLGSTTIGSAGDIDFFKIRLAAGRTYRITMQSISPAFDNQLDLYSPAGDFIMNRHHNIGVNAQITYSPTVTGYFYIRATAYYSSGVGAYVITVEDINTCSAACTDCQAVDALCSICSAGYVCNSCSSSPASQITGAACFCDVDEIYSSGSCIACSSLDTNCRRCSSPSVCTSCTGSLLIYGASCVPSCPVGSYQSGGSCISCSTLHTSCTACNSSSTCTQCSGSLVALGASCIASCPDGTYNNGGLCTSCKTLNDYCTSCNSSLTCTACSSSKYALGSTCVTSCPGNTYLSGGICTSCKTLDPVCSTCNSSSSCLTCSSSKYALGPSCVNNCPGGTYINGGSICISCKTLDNYCTSCNGSISCTGCSNSKYALGSSCVDNCAIGTYNNGGICTSCKVLDNFCSSCNSSLSCTGCSNSKYALGPQCVDNCPGDTFINSGVCTSCKTLDNFCTTCNSSVSCISCSNSKFALGSKCVDSCPYGTFAKQGICTSCATLDNSCLGCNSTTSCTQCSGGLMALGPTCVAQCPSMTYNNAGICTSCVTLDNSCMSCNSSMSCLGCSGGLLAFGPTCTFDCPVKTFDSNGVCLSCKTLDDRCLECSNNRFCSLCDNKMLILGSNCIKKCPSGTQNTEGICSSTKYQITLAYTDSTSSYLVQFPTALVYDVNVLQVSTVTLEGIDPEAYNYTLIKRSNTIYQIDFRFTQSIPSTTLKFTYFLNGSQLTNNLLIGKWIAEIITKYEGYMSEADRATVEAINSVVSGAMQGATSGAGSMAVLGGNPALLWPLLNLFQTFYYLIFIDVNYPANVQMFLKIFSLGSLSFLPNPLEWFVQDIDNYDLAVPRRYNDYNFSGLFLDNSGNELLLLSLVFGLYLVSKGAKKWLRRLPTSVRLFTNKTVGWFEWSGILRSLITSYTDMAQAIFLQMRVLTFYSTVFMLSTILSFVALGFVLIFPVMIYFIIKGYDEHPELLYIKYDTLIEEYDIKKKSGRYFVPIWLVRRLIMCLSLVFLQGYPYVQINVLCILVIGTIFHSWVYGPYTTKKENICNTIMEILFGCIHAVIYVLIYDDHNPYFSEKQRLQMGWVIIFACGNILIISLGLSLFDQIKEVIRGIRLLKRLLSKPTQKKKRKIVKFETGKKVFERHYTTALDQSQLDGLNRDLERDTQSPSSETSGSGSGERIPLARRIPISELKRVKKARIAKRIRELRAINSGK